MRFTSVGETAVEVEWEQLNVPFDGWEICFRNMVGPLQKPSLGFYGRELLSQPVFLEIFARHNLDFMSSPALLWTSRKVALILSHQLLSFCGWYVREAL